MQIGKCDFHKNMSLASGAESTYSRGEPGAVVGALGRGVSSTLR